MLLCVQSHVIRRCNLHTFPLREFCCTVAWAQSLEQPRIGALCCAKLRMHSTIAFLHVIED